MSSVRNALKRVAAAFPAGVSLDRADWENRHRWINGLVLAHVPIIVVFAFARGFAPMHNLAEAVPVAALGLVASRSAYSTRARSIIAGLGLMVSSAVLVHLSGGATEMHFHFFVMLGVISLYQDWRPFLVSIAFVAGHHAVMGSLYPREVFDHSSAWNSPLKWALIHAFFVLAASAVSVVSWHIIEEGHRRALARIEASERRFRALIERSSDVVTVVDAAGVVVYDSPSLQSVFGYAPGERLGVNGIEYVHADDADRVVRALTHVGDRPGTVGTVEARVRHRNGEYRWVEATVTNMLDEPSVNGLVANFRDVTERKALEDQLAHQAFHDPLTSLANRALLLDRIEHARATASRRGRASMALVYVDLDDFKTVNDGMGHEAGDELLRLAASRIVGAVRAGDTAARLGGDEFGVLLENLDTPGQAYEVGARVLETLAEPFNIAGAPVSINASIGIAVSDGSDDGAALLRNADLAMYQAKGGGKGRYEVYEAGMHAAVVERMAMKADLLRAVDADEFDPYYQPIVDLDSGRVTGVEALVRWRHPERGLMPPASFIPLAEETGLIIPIGRRMLQRACADMASWRTAFGAEAPSSVSVNLSPRQIQRPQVVADVADALAASALPPECLVLEITESTLLDDAAAAATTLAALKDLGVRIALDDFGTGYSSLSYLDRFPVDIVKIDKSFVDGLGADVAGSPLVGAIVNLGSLLGLGVTAEGIEREDQVARLRQIGCAQGQGFYFARPMPACDLVATLGERAAGERSRERRPATAGR